MTDPARLAQIRERLEAFLPRGLGSTTIAS